MINFSNIKNYIQKEEGLIVLGSMVFYTILGIYQYVIYKNLFFWPADIDEFIYPFDSFAETGSYSYYGKPYAGRPPGLFIPYGFFRMFFNSYVSLYLSGIFQIALKIFSIVYLWRLFKKLDCLKFVSLIFLLIYLCSPIWMTIDFVLHPYSISASITIILIYYIYKISTEEIEQKNLFVLGILFTYLYFLRPYLLIIYIIAFLYVLYLSIVRFKSLVISTKLLLYFLFPFLILESAWVVRNYLTFKDLILVQTTHGLSNKSLSLSEYGFNNPLKPSLLPLRKLFVVWGYPLKWYDGKGRSIHTQFIRLEDTALWYIPPEAYNGLINRDSILYLKRLIGQSFLQKNDSLEHLIYSVSQRYLKYYRQESPIRYWLTSTIIKIKYLLFIHLQDERFNKNMNFLLWIKMCVYYFVLFSGFVGSLALWNIRRYSNEKKRFILFLSLSNFLFIILFSLLIDTVQLLYFLSGYLMLFVLSAILVNELIKRFRHA